MPSSLWKPRHPRDAFDPEFRHCAFRCRLVRLRGLAKELPGFSGSPKSRGRPGAQGENVMAVDVVMPQMGESIFEGTITKWLKKPGDKVERDEPLFEISTDKVDAEIPSPSAGVLKEIKIPEGQTVPIQTVVAVIDGAGTAAASAPSPAVAAAPAPA